MEIPHRNAYIYVCVCICVRMYTCMCIVETLGVSAFHRNVLGMKRFMPKKGLKLILQYVGIKARKLQAAAKV